MSLTIHCGETLAEIKKLDAFHRELSSSSVLTSCIGVLITVERYSWFPFEMESMESLKEPVPLIGEGCLAEMCTTHDKEP